MQTPLGRWIIVLPNAQTWAWSGSRFIEHHHGVSREAQVANFATEQEALDYATEHVIAKSKDEEKTLHHSLLEALKAFNQAARQIEGSLSEKRPDLQSAMAIATQLIEKSDKAIALIERSK
jgi:hypothetical protein